MQAEQFNHNKVKFRGGHVGASGRSEYQAVIPPFERDDLLDDYFEGMMLRYPPMNGDQKESAQPGKENHGLKSRARKRRERRKKERMLASKPVLPVESSKPKVTTPSSNEEDLGGRIDVYLSNEKLLKWVQQVEGEEKRKKDVEETRVFEVIQGPSGPGLSLLPGRTLPPYEFPDNFVLCDCRAKKQDHSRCIICMYRMEPGHHIIVGHGIKGKKCSNGRSICNDISCINKL
jgi:hypothetical protein